MGVGLEHVIRTDPGFAIFSGGSVNRHKFTEVVSVTDDDGAVFACKFQILRVFPDDCVRIDVIVLSHSYVFGNNGMSSDFRAFTDFTVGTDDRIGSDDYIFMKYGSRVNHGGLMNFRFG